MDIFELDVPCKLQFLTWNEGTKRPPLVVSKNLTLIFGEPQFSQFCAMILWMLVPLDIMHNNNNNNYQTSLFSHTTFEKIRELHAWGQGYYDWCPFIQFLNELLAWLCNIIIIIIVAVCWIEYVFNLVHHNVIEMPAGERAEQ